MGLNRNAPQYLRCGRRNADPEIRHSPESCSRAQNGDNWGIADIFARLTERLLAFSAAIAARSSDAVARRLRLSRSQNGAIVFNRTEVAVHNSRHNHLQTTIWFGQRNSS